MISEHPWLLDSNHGLDSRGLELAARRMIDDRDDDPDRLMYGARLHADGSKSLTCPMVPYWVLVAERLIPVIKEYMRETT